MWDAFLNGCLDLVLMPMYHGAKPFTCHSVDRDKIQKALVSLQVVNKEEKNTEICLYGYLTKKAARLPPLNSIACKMMVPALYFETESIYDDQHVK